MAQGQGLQARVAVDRVGKSAQHSNLSRRCYRPLVPNLSVRLLPTLSAPKFAHSIGFGFYY